MDKPIEYVNNTIQKVSDALQQIEEAMASLHSGPSNYYFTKMRLYAEGLFKMSPYKIGDNICLRHTLDIGQGSGWRHCRHFLIKGASGVVREIDYDESGFVYGIIFDNESFIDQHGDECPVKDKHLFYIEEPKIILNPEK